MYRKEKAELPPILDKDYYTFAGMLNRQLKASQLADLERDCLAIFLHKERILSSEQNKESWERNGFAYNARTLQSVFYGEGHQIDSDLESSDEEEEEVKIDADQVQQELDGRPVEEESKGQHPQEEQFEQLDEYNASSLIDLDSIDPVKVNWFKYIIDQKL